MAKLHFRYGTIGSGKSLDMLKTAYNYEENGLNALLITSSVDDRYGSDIVKSRTGVEKSAIGIHENDNIFDIIEYKQSIRHEPIHCVLVDEVQFFTNEHILQLAEIVDNLDIPVICYGLRSDFKQEPFGASKTLMAIADEIEEMKTICSSCGKKKASINAKYEGDKIITSGEQIEIGGNEKYKPLCRRCYNSLK